ncbi:MAG: hypothetical protein HC827_08075 [Cyanobacteria bacterium RM1_2_2]|nr:hypothetical protein [Cyanobacteria bacterium RM1_2_2]
MNGTTSQNGKNGSKTKWREVTSCDTECILPDPKPTPCPKPTNCETIREKDSKETYYFMSTTESEHKNSGGISKLAGLLLGLATLLFLGSMLSNLFMVWTLARVTNNSNNSNNSKEVVTTTTTKEIIREVDGSKQAGDEYYYYAPAARW